LVKEWFSTAELGWIYRHATAVVSRSGANTIQELQYFAVPSLLIPLPFSRRNEQTLNAQHLVKLGGALMLDQTQSSSADLATALHNLKKQSAEFKKQLQAHPIATDATDRLWNVILKNINSNPSLSHD
jgi:UDP-N-acetylglucosamine--N-acetylmuramyl-(pentapeptide) pyrophosphoryl-undecaprenol N-acetylglucosamine transferase